MSVRPRTEVENLAPIARDGLDFAELEQLGIPPSEVWDFSLNINPLGPPQAALDAVATVNVMIYPDPEAIALRRALATRLNVPAENILVGGGATEIIHALALAYLRPGDKVLVVGPTFGEYAVAARLMGAEVLEVRAEEDYGFEPDISGIVRQVAEQAPRLNFICNPNNPTGYYMSQMALEKILDANRSGLVVLDEAYVNFIGDRWNSLPAALNRDLVVLRSLTEDYALPAMRLGYAVAQQEILDAIRRVRPPWSVNALAQASGTAAVQDENHLVKGRVAANQGKSFLLAGLRERGFKPLSSSANFFMVDVGNATAFRERMLAKKVQVRDCTSFGLPRFVRIGARQLTDCWKLLEAVADVQKEYSPSTYEPISATRLLEAMQEAEKEPQEEGKEGEEQR